MNTHRTIAVFLVCLILSIPPFGRAQSKEQLGKVDFQNSCSPAVQETFQRAVAMLHSFRYAETEKAFREVLTQDPSCAIATWGIAAILMSNPLAGVGPSPQWAERAQAAIDQGRKIGAKTQRERDYVEAVAAYYEDWANRPERARAAQSRPCVRGAGRALSERRRGADLLRALPRGDAVASRPELQNLSRGGRNTREAIREAP